MMRSIHPDAYDWFIKMGDTPKQIAGYIDEFVIGVYDAHADLRAEGKLPAIMFESVETDESYDPSILTDEELEMWKEAQEDFKVEDGVGCDIMNTKL